MAKEVIWTPEAEDSFLGVIEYLQREWTDREIESFIAATDKIIEHISEHPKMFRRTRKKTIHEALITTHNLLIYKIYPDRIMLIAFWDTRKNPKKKKY